MNANIERHKNIMNIANSRGSLLEAITKKDKSLIKELEERAENGEIIRIM